MLMNDIFIPTTIPTTIRQKLRYYCGSELFYIQEAIDIFERAQAVLFGSIDLLQDRMNKAGQSGLPNLLMSPPALPSHPKPALRGLDVSNVYL